MLGESNVFFRYHRQTEGTSTQTSNGAMSAQNKYWSFQAGLPKNCNYTESPCAHDEGIWGHQRYSSTHS